MRYTIFIIIASLLVAGCTATPAAPQITATPTQAATMAMATPIPVPQPTGHRAVVQTPDHTVAFLDASGKVTALGKAPARLSSAPFAAASAHNTVFGLSASLPSGAYAFSVSGAQTLSFVGTN